jgi:hypothetical protein
MLIKKPRISNNSFKFLPVFFGVIVMPDMDEFMENDIIHEIIRQSYNFNIQADVLFILA